WPLPSMAPLAHTLALLAMTVATTAIKEVTLDMAPNSFDDQYQGCSPNMTKELPALNHSEFQQNKIFARAWARAVAEWNNEDSTVSFLPFRHTIALRAYMMDDLYEEFNTAVREAGRSPEEYRDNFHFKVLHFLLTDALERLGDSVGWHCQCVFQTLKGVRFEAEPGDTVRLGQFMWMSHCGGSPVTGVDTMLQVETCHSMDFLHLSSNPSKKQVLISPFETFRVVYVARGDNMVHIQLNSTGTHSKYNCEWLRGDLMGITWGKR
ncbi:NARE ribosyltransferase, partial [Mystacornis crossleyi]|nr:NARE ribosyltransferase [Mystacornis crossleyi]